MKNLKGVLIAAFWLFVLYESQAEFGAIADLPGAGKSHISLLFIGLLCAGGGYLLGVAREKQRSEDKRIEQMIERQRRLDAARTPEEHEALERKRIRNLVINHLSSEEKAIFMVAPPPDDPKALAQFALLEERIDKEVARILREESIGARVD